MIILNTARLRLEPFDDSHLDGLARMNADPEVTRYVGGKPETREETMAAIERVKGRWAHWGYSWWSFIEIETNEIIGAGCIQRLGHERANPMEIGWRLRRDKWGQGYASEAARTMAAFAFDTLGTDVLCAICEPENVASARVMERLGMRFRAIETWNDTDHKVYEMTSADWMGALADVRLKSLLSGDGWNTSKP
jgi:RimJ/RimL family protein N-acetyltransferase